MNPVYASVFLVHAVDLSVFLVCAVTPNQRVFRQCCRSIDVAFVSVFFPVALTSLYKLFQEYNQRDLQDEPADVFSLGCPDIEADDFQL